jgi:hypothetical protein
VALAAGGRLVFKHISNQHDGRYRWWLLYDTPGDPLSDPNVKSFMTIPGIPSSPGQTVWPEDKPRIIHVRAAYHIVGTTLGYWAWLKADTVNLTQWVLSEDDTGNGSFNGAVFGVELL